MQDDNHPEELSNEALFESLGHPIRIKILEGVNPNPLSFSQIKRKVGIDSSGHLTFHLDKLKGFLKINTDGNYELTDDGKEALRLVSIFNAAGKERSEGKKNNLKRNSNIVWACALIIIVAISAVFVNSMYGTYLAIRNDQGNQQTYSQFWLNLDNARVNVNDAITATEAEDYCTARYKLAIAEVYLDLLVFQSSGIISLGQDFVKIYNEGLHSIYLLKPTLSRINGSLANGSVTEGQLSFLENLSLALQALRDDMQHAEGGPYTITNVNDNINLFKALADMIS